MNCFINTARLAASSLVFLFVAGCAQTQIQPLSGTDQTLGWENSSRLERVEALAQQAVDTNYAPGVVIYLQSGEDAPYEYAYGWRDKSSDAPQSTSDLFRIYSMTKPVTVAAAMILVDDGVLGLDDPVSKYIPAFGSSTVFVSGTTLESIQTEPLDRPVTIRDLMRHTAGMAYKSRAEDPVNQLYILKGIDTGSGADIGPQDGSDPVESAYELAERLAEIPLREQPGGKYTYGNATDVLGAVIEVASGESLGAFMKRRIFAPLSMDDTFFKVPSEAAPRMTAAYGARSTLGEPVSVLGAAKLEQLTVGALREIDSSENSLFMKQRAMHYGGAGLVSTAADYAQFARMLLNGGELEGERIVSERSVAEMFTNQLPESALAASPRLATDGLAFGLGGAIVTDSEKFPGNMPEGVYFWAGAASTYFWIDPKTDRVGIIMTQVFGGDFRAFVLAMIEEIYREDGNGA